jgi:hypothetical protein
MNFHLDADLKRHENKKTQRPPHGNDSLLSELGVQKIKEDWIMSYDISRNVQVCANISPA